MSGQAMQADGGGAKRGDATGAGRTGGGESGGGASAGNQGTDGDSKSPIGHGGQSEIGYHGPGQLGHQKVDEDDSPNATTKGG